MKHLIMLMCALHLFLFTAVSYGTNYNYVTISIDDNYSVEIPYSWKQHEAAKNEALQKTTDKKLNSLKIKQPPGQNMIIFSANAYDKSGESLASARLSVRDMDELSQADAKQFTNAEVQEIGLASKKALEGGLTEMGLKTRYIRTNKQTINGKICIVTEIEMTTPEGKLLRQITDTYFLGKQALKMTTSYNSAIEKTYRPVVNRIRNSLIIK